MEVERLDGLAADAILTRLIEGTAG
jgi:hypothetical protein